MGVRRKHILNIQKTISRAGITKRVVKSWVIVAVVFTLLGIVIGYVIKSQISGQQNENSVHRNEEVFEICFTGKK